MSRKIPLQNGMFAIVDKEDYEKVNRFNWYSNTGESGTSLNVENGKCTLGKFILNAKEGEFVIRIDKANFNYTKENLLLVTKRQMSFMRRGNRNSTSKYKGVYWVSSENKWRSALKVGEKVFNIGRFTSEDEAAKEYNKKAIELLGEYAYVNKIGEDNNARTFKRKSKRMQPRKRNSLGYRGIRRSLNKYQAQISIQGKKTYLGQYETKEQAAKAYDKKAYELHGDKAILNFPELIEHYKEETE